MLNLFTIDDESFCNLFNQITLDLYKSFIFDNFKNMWKFSLWLLIKMLGYYMYIF